MHSVLSYACRVAGVLILLISSFAPDTFASSQCPQNSVSCADGTFYSTDPTFSRNCGNAGSASYSIPNGTLAASMSASSAGASTEDVYEIVGLPPGTQLTFSALLWVTVSFYAYSYPYFCPGSAQVFLDEGTGGGPIYNWQCSNQFQQGGFSLSLQHASGESFHVHCQVQIGGGTLVGGTINGTLSFVDLPPGAAVISCNGYQQGTPLPVHAATWGYVKSMYR